MRKKNRNIDNNGTIFPYLIGKKYNGIFYMGINFNILINKDKLYHSVLHALKVYPDLKVKLAHNFFNYYFKKNEKEFLLSEDNSPSNFLNDYLFKIVYSKQKVCLYMYHFLGDGMTAKKFLECILNYYCKFEEIENDYTVDDCYLKLYNKWKYSKETIHPPKNKNFLIFKNPTHTNNSLKYQKINIKIKKIKNRSQKHLCTITEYLTAMLIFILNNNNSHKSVICVPIDLRKYLKANVMNNFFSYMFISSDKKAFDDIVEDVKMEFYNQNNKNYIYYILKRNIKLKKAFKFVPLIFKKIIIPNGYWRTAKKSTTVLSNVGMLNIDNKIIDSFECYAEPDPTKLIKFTISSTNDILTINISSKLKDETLIKNINDFINKQLY